MAKMTGGEALVATLYREGVRVAFALPGVQLSGVIRLRQAADGRDEGFALPGVQLSGVIAALRDEPRIRFTTTRPERATSHMAGGDARSRCRSGCRAPSFFPEREAPGKHGR